MYGHLNLSPSPLQVQLIIWNSAEILSTVVKFLLVSPVLTFVRLRATSLSDWPFACLLKTSQPLWLPFGSLLRKSLFAAYTNILCIFVRLYSCQSTGSNQFPVDKQTSFLLFFSIICLFSLLCYLARRYRRIKRELAVHGFFAFGWMQQVVVLFTIYFSVQQIDPFSDIQIKKHDGRL